MEKKRIRRSLLFVPASSEKMMAKACDGTADGIILDLEDSVSLAEKEGARARAKEAVKQVRDKGKEAIVRVNAVTSLFGIRDIVELSATQPDALIIPKADKKSLITADTLLAAAEVELGLAENTIKLIPLIETVGGVVDINAILRSVRRLSGVLLGAEDLTKELGIERTAEGREIQHARNRVVLAGCACGIDIIDTPFTAIKDLAGLEAETKAVKALGFSGKACIHPSQVEIVNAVFTPGEAIVEYSKKLLEAFALSVREGKGACTFDGKMVDAPIADKARRIVEMANFINQIS